MHEHLHCVESNSSVFNGWDGFTPVHNNADHGFTDDSKYGWVDCYSALMRDSGSVADWAREGMRFAAGHGLY